MPLPQPLPQLPLPTDPAVINMSEYIAALVITRLHPWLTDVTQSLQRIERDLDTIKRNQKDSQRQNQNGITLGHVYEPQPDPAASLGNRMNEMVQKRTEQHIAEQTGLRFGEAGGRYRCERCAGGLS